MSFSGARQPAWPLSIFTPLTPWPLWKKLHFTTLSIYRSPSRSAALVFKCWFKNTQIPHAYQFITGSKAKPFFLSAQSVLQPVDPSVGFQSTSCKPDSGLVVAEHDLKGKTRKTEWEESPGEDQRNELLPQIPCTFMFPISFRGISKPPAPHSEVGDLSLGVIMFVV